MSSVRKKRMLYPEQSLEAALKAVKAGMSINGASAKFQIPRSTLHCKVIGKYENKKPGPRSVLSPSLEAQLVKWIVSCSDFSHTVTKIQLLNSVRMLVKQMDLKNPFTENGPGRTWFEGFLKRNKMLKSKIMINPFYSYETRESDLRKWFSQVKAHLLDRDLLDIDACRIFNADETSVLLNPKIDKSLTKDRRFSKDVYTVVNDNEKDILTVLVTGNAAGQLVPPLILFPYNEIIDEINEKMPEGWSYGQSDSGWMTAEYFYEYITNVFHNWLITQNIQLPVVLFVDGHASYLTQPLVEFCCKNKIELIALHPNSTPIIQPMDQSMFTCVRRAWESQVIIYKEETNLSSVTEVDVAPILKKALDNLDVVDILKNGFEKCGLKPFCADVIDYSEIFRQTNSELDGEHSQECVSNHAFALQYIEDHVNSKTLAYFQLAAVTNKWTGPTEDTSLFNIWKDLSNIVKSDNKNTNHVSSTTMNTKASTKKNHKNNAHDDKHNDQNDDEHDNDFQQDDDNDDNPHDQNDDGHDSENFGKNADTHSDKHDDKHNDYFNDGQYDANNHIYKNGYNDVGEYEIGFSKL